MNTLSIWKPVAKKLMWMGLGIRAVWRINKFDYFPSEKNLFTSLWYYYAHFRLVRPEETIYDFIDLQKMYLEVRVASKSEDKLSTQLSRNLLNGLEHENIRNLFIAFLESESPHMNYRPLLQAVRSIWRVKDKVWDLNEDNKPVSVMTASSGSGEANAGEDRLYAKTYFIAAELHHELAGQDPEFQSLSRRIPDLERFIQVKFSVQHLPGTIEKLKGYSYKVILKEKSRARRGQLRPPLRQIVERPMIFGDAIAARAKEILDKNLK